MPQIGETASGGGIEMRVSSVGSIEKLEKEYGEEDKARLNYPLRFDT